MNTNYNMHVAYRPASMSAIRFHEPEKATLLDNYFGFRIPNHAVPTVNLTLGVISPSLTHLTLPNYKGYCGEYRAIVKSCETGNPIKVFAKSYYFELNGCIFAYVADVSLNVLKSLMVNPTLGPAVDTRKALKEKELLKKNQEIIKKLQKENIMLRTTIEDVLKIVAANKK